MKEYRVSFYCGCFYVFNDEIVGTGATLETAVARFQYVYESISK